MATMRPPDVDVLSLKALKRFETLPETRSSCETPRGRIYATLMFLFKENDRRHSRLGAGT